MTFQEIGRDFIGCANSYRICDDAGLVMFWVHCGDDGALETKCTRAVGLWKSQDAYLACYAAELEVMKEIFAFDAEKRRTKKEL